MNYMGRYFLILQIIFAGHLTRAAEATFTTAQCRVFSISRGDGGQGILRYCDNGSHQRVYVSGEMDVQESGRDRERDLRSIRSVLALMKKRQSATFEVITENAGGGEVSWHQSLIMGVEDACTGGRRIGSRLRGLCESACSQLHLTCARGAKTYLLPGSRFCEHATTDEESCSRCDPHPPRECDICDPAETVMEYKDRCDRLLRGRRVAVDEERKRIIGAFADHLKNTGVFDSHRMVCVRPPWAESDRPLPTDQLTPMSR